MPRNSGQSFLRASSRNIPIAKAIVERAKKEGLELEPVVDFESIPGKGVRGKIKGEATGIIALMDKIRDATIKSIADLRRQGIRTEMITGDNERIAIGIILLVLGVFTTLLG